MEDKNSKPSSKKYQTPTSTANSHNKQRPTNQANSNSTTNANTKKYHKPGQPSHGKNPPQPTQSFPSKNTQTPTPYFLDFTKIEKVLSSWPSKSPPPKLRVLVLSGALSPIHNLHIKCFTLAAHCLTNTPTTQDNNDNDDNPSNNPQNNSVQSSRDVPEYCPYYCLDSYYQSLSNSTVSSNDGSNDKGVKYVGPSERSRSASLPVVGGFLCPSSDWYVGGKLGKEAISLVRRCHMTRLATENHPWLDVDASGTASATKVVKETERLLQRQFRGRGVEFEVWLVAGSDHALKHRLWTKKEKVVCVGRGEDSSAIAAELRGVYRGVEVGGLVKGVRYGDSFVVVTGSEEVSSTLVRQLIAEKRWEDMRTIVPDPVVAYLEEEGAAVFDLWKG